jgi:pimeloyl-ACP methyl ester carboxylesterase
MATFVLIHGASANPGYWARVAPALRAAGHEVMAPALPTSDASATFETYAQAVTDVIRTSRDGVVVVGQSMGTFTAPVVATKVPVAMIVLVAPMIPAPGETPAQWGPNVGLADAQQRYADAEGFAPAFDVMTTLMHDVPPEVAGQLMAAGEPPQAETIFSQPFPLDAWPAVPTRVHACVRDRMFPLELVRRLAQERLGVKADEIDSGHLPGFAHPDELARKLLGYRAAQAG